MTSEFERGELTPVDYNGQLAAIFRTMPNFTSILSEGHMEKTRERETYLSLVDESDPSKYSTAIANKVRPLLNNHCSLPQPIQELVVTDFKLNSFHGNFAKTIEEHPRWTTYEFEKTDGLFDTATSQRVAKNLIKAVLFEMNLALGITNVFEQRGFKIDLYSNHQPLMEILGAARQAYIEEFVEEP